MAEPGLEPRSGGGPLPASCYCYKEQGLVCLLSHLIKPLGPYCATKRHSYYQTPERLWELSIT